MLDEFKLKSDISFNIGSLESLKNISGKKAFIVSDLIMDKLGYLEKTIQYLNEANIESTVFTGVHPDPGVQVLSDGIKLYNECNPDVLIAIGGGSTIDSAKGILYFSYHMNSVSNEKNNKKPLFIAIPSTSGTGSEVTNFTVITSKDEKICIVDDFIAPDLAILDSSCIENVPKNVIADTGIDALVHAIEAYVSTKATDFTDALAEKAIKLIFDNIKAVYDDPSNSFSRDKVQNASCMAGIAFTNTSLGINHSLAHAIGGIFHIPHGRANAILLNPVIEYNSELNGSANSIATKKYANIAKILGLQARTPREGVVSLMNAIYELENSLDIVANIKSTNIDIDEFIENIEKMSETALADRCTPTNPRIPSKEDLMNIYKKIC